MCTHGGYIKWIGSAFGNLNTLEPNKEESSIGAVNACKKCIVKTEFLKIVLLWIGVDAAETKYDIFFVKRKLKFIKE